MDLQKFRQIIQESVSDADLLNDEIPKIDLYLDQIITLTQEKFVANKRTDSDKLLTKTMINNYSKDGLIKPVKGKKYSHELILQMLLVYSLKNTLTITEIKNLLNGIYTSKEYSPEMLEKSYSRYTGMKDSQRKRTQELVDILIDSNDIDVEKQEDLFVLILGIASLSNYLKNVAKDLIEQEFPTEDNIEDAKNHKKIEKEKAKEKKE